MKSSSHFFWTKNNGTSMGLFSILKKYCAGYFGHDKYFNFYKMWYIVFRIWFEIIRQNSLFTSKLKFTIHTHTYKFLLEGPTAATALDSLDWPTAVIFVSHDSTFATCTHLFLAQCFLFEPFYLAPFYLNVVDKQYCNACAPRPWPLKMASAAANGFTWSPVMVINLCCCDPVLDLEAWCHY